MVRLPTEREKISASNTFIKGLIFKMWGKLIQSNIQKIIIIIKKWKEKLV